MEKSENEDACRSKEHRQESRPRAAEGKQRRANEGHGAFTRASARAAEGAQQRPSGDRASDCEGAVPGAREQRNGRETAKERGEANGERMEPAEAAGWRTDENEPTKNGKIKPSNVTEGGKYRSLEAMTRKKQGSGDPQPAPRRPRAKRTRGEGLEERPAQREQPHQRAPRRRKCQRRGGRLPSGPEKNERERGHLAEGKSGETRATGKGKRHGEGAAKGRGRESARRRSGPARQAAAQCGERDDVRAGPSQQRPNTKTAGQRPDSQKQVCTMPSSASARSRNERRKTQTGAKSRRPEHESAREQQRVKGGGVRWRGASSETRPGSSKGSQKGTTR